MEYRLEEPLIEHIGGLEKAINLLQTMRSHEDCCGQYWKRYEDYGRGRAARKVVGHHFDRVYGGVDWKMRDIFSIKQLESVIAARLADLNVIVSGHSKLSYNSVSERPILRAKTRYSNQYWEQSPPMVIRYMYDGKESYVMGYYNYSLIEGHPDEFHMEGHNGNWQETVTGWAYV